MVNDVKSGRLVLSPYFQRNLVWREIHQKEFIETILKGYPFPQIFVARGDINVDTMTSISCVVDGQQRMNAIKEYVGDKFSVGGEYFSQLGTGDKEEFLTYQIPVIDLDIKATDQSIIDIFKRLNRTFYALSTIEKMASEFATVDFMLVAKYLCDLLPERDENDESEGVDLKVDPNMPEGFFRWAKVYDISGYRDFVFNENLFSRYETSRLVHLMYTLNIMSTVCFGIGARNDKTKEILDSKADEFPYRDKLISNISPVSKFILSMEFPETSIWWNKASAFSLFVVVFWNLDILTGIGREEVQARLSAFEADLPADYALAAREAVNNRKQRVERHAHICQAIGIQKEEKPFHQ